MEPAAAAAYADSSFASLVRAGLDASSARVLEIGPGESLALGLRLVAAGASEVVAVDRFDVQAPEERRRAVYEALLGDEEAVRAALAHVRLMAGVPIEEATRHLEPASFDAVVSISALQHTSDLEATLHSLAQLLKPGGTMVHQVDLGDMGLFTGHGGHPLEMLTLPARLYRAMGSQLGTPNRERIATYRETLEALGFDLTITATEEIDPGAVEAIRPRLRAPYRELSDEDLRVTSAMVVARKRARAG
jgi:SAM-dependent methyltransferase